MQSAHPPTLQLAVRKPAFRSLWIKYVVGFNIKRHCAAGLIGRYSKLLPYKVRREPFEISVTLGEHPFKFIYLCGNTGVWERNIHVAVRVCPGGSVEYQDELLSLKFADAEQVPIHPVVDQVPFGTQFTTCRNWQFGFEYLGGREQLLAMSR